MYPIFQFVCARVSFQLTCLHALCSPEWQVSEDTVWLPSTHGHTNIRTLTLTSTHTYARGCANTFTPPTPILAPVDCVRFDRYRAHTDTSPAFVREGVRGKGECADIKTPFVGWRGGAPTPMSPPRARPERHFSQFRFCAQASRATQRLSYITGRRWGRKPRLRAAARERAYACTEAADVVSLDWRVTWICHAWLLSEKWRRQSKHVSNESHLTTESYIIRAK